MLAPVANVAIEAVPDASDCKVNLPVPVGVGKAVAELIMSFAPGFKVMFCVVGVALVPQLIFTVKLPDTVVVPLPKVLLLATAEFDKVKLAKFKDSMV